MQPDATDNTADAGQSGRNGRPDAPSAAGKPWGDLQIRRILDALADGATYQDASRAAGVAPRTFRRWRANHPELQEAVHRAEAECAAAALGNIRRAAEDGKWRASAWLLERRHGYTEPGALDDETVREFTDIVKTTIRDELPDDDADRVIDAIGAVLTGTADG